MLLVFELLLKICNVFDKKPFALWNLTDWTCEFYHIHIFVFTDFDYLSKNDESLFWRFFPIFLSIPDKHFFSFLIFREFLSLQLVLNCSITDFLVSVFCLFSFFVNTFLTFIYKIFPWLDNYLYFKLLFSVKRNTTFHQFVWLSSIVKFKSRSTTKLFTFIII